MTSLVSAAEMVRMKREPSFGKENDTHYENEHSAKRVRRRPSATVSLQPTAAVDVNDMLKRAEKFKPGQLLRADLDNFQVCDKASYNFHPGLNMIVGPNGSGKSTVITAVYLLFCGSRSDTARESFDDFIRIGANEGHATVWLKTNDVNNPITEISLLLRRSAQPSYKINGKSVTIDRVRQLAEKHDIRVNNRCQFLPQERVASFSAETAHQRLISTLQSVGENGMTTTLEQLIEIGKRARDSQTKAGENNDTITQLQLDETEQKTTVERLKQSRDDKREITVLEGAKTILKYNQRKESMHEHESKLERAELQLRQFDAANSDLTQEIRVFKDMRSELNRKAQVLAADKRPVDKHTSACIDRLKEETLSSSTNTYKVYEEELRSWKEDVQKAERGLSAARTELEKQQEKYSDETMLSAKTQYDKLSAEAAELQKNASNKENSAKEKKAKIDRRESEKAKLSNEMNAFREGRLKQLRNTDAEQVKSAMTLITQNQSQMVKPVLPPPILTCRIKSGAEKQLSAIVKPWNLNVFICQSKEDFNAVSKLFQDNKITCRVMQYSSSSQTRSSPLTRSQLEECGFSGYLSDIIEDDETVLNCLNSTMNLDTIPYATGRLPAPLVDKIKSLNGLPIRRYVDSDATVNITKSKYGMHQVSHTVAKYRANTGWIFACKTSRDELLRSIKERTESANSEIQRLKEEIYVIDEEATKITERRMIKMREAEEHKKVYRTQSSIKKVVTGLKSDIARDEDTLQSSKDRKESFDKRQKEIIDDLINAPSVSRSDKLSSLLVQSLTIGAQHSHAVHGLEVARGSAKRIEFDISGQKTKIEKAIEECKKMLVEAKRVLEELQPQVEALKESLGVESFESAKQLATRMSLEDITRAIVNKKTALELAEEGQTYEEAKAQLQETSERLADLLEIRATEQSNLEAAQNQLNTALPDFQKKSEEFVEGISSKYGEFFDRLGCQGSVHLLCPELEFEKWGIEIRVSYREGEPMRPLSSKTQSGGEKAVATAVYLMALQEYALAPFFVVDEINQGMDKHNERAIHRFIVETACEHNKAQYFLVTPKMLPDLCYHPNMKILCNNSSNMVEHFTQTVQDIIKGAKQLGPL